MNYNFFTGHNTFYLREGWLQKGLIEIKKNPEIFQANKLIEAIDSLGIGSNMVKSLKYWLQYFDLIEEETKQNLKINEFAKIILSFDKLLNKKGTLWLLHLKSCNNSLIWSIMFREMEISKFSKELMYDRIETRLKEDGHKFAKKTIKNSINVFIKTYFYEHYDDPENNVYSPLSKLRLIEKDDDNNHKFRYLSHKEIPEYFIYYIIFKAANKIIQDKAFELINKIIRIDMNNFKKILRQLEKKKIISIDRAGVNNISKIQNLSEEEIINRIINGNSNE